MDDSHSCPLFWFALKWIFLQSVFIKSASIKEKRTLILITQDRALPFTGQPQMPERIIAQRTHCGTTATEIPEKRHGDKDLREFSKMIIGIPYRSQEDSHRDTWQETKVQEDECGQLIRSWWKTEGWEFLVLPSNAAHLLDLRRWGHYLNCWEKTEQIETIRCAHSNQKPTQYNTDTQWGVRRTESELGSMSVLEFYGRIFSMVTRVVLVQNARGNFAQRCTECLWSCHKFKVS